MINHQDKIHVVGIGLDGSLGLTDKVRRLIEEATFLVGSQRHLSYFPHHPAQKVILGNFLEAIVDIRRAFQEGKRIVILVSGDPLFFGLGRLLLEKFPSDLLNFHPHLNCVQLAFNRLKIPWQDAKIFSAHGRSLDELSLLLQQGEEKIAILTDGDNSPSAIARFYQSLALPIPYQFWVCENLEAAQEKIYQFSPEEIATLASLSDNHFAALNVVILIRQHNLSENPLLLNNLPLIGLSDQTFISFSDRPGLMTKREIRLMILGELALQPGQIVWDIGAGTGSVSLEIGRLCPTSQVYAIEKTAMGITLIEQNRQRLQVNNVIPIAGTAPEILHQLPQPQRIFIGGSGGNLRNILEVCGDKLAANGLVVLAFATVEHINESVQWFSQNNWHYRLLQVSISRSVAVGKFTRFSPLNPVTIITANLSLHFFHE
ncbi:bifunctional cobalt-precorrin-7 (C(5))-methyltransferase/cobalt-precorrin-6B (C(15))-methyltransferase [Gloeothece verrucosa]|uniref:Precorrin-6y C5,15-methyltransferase (Decarboxylating), CbiE subunit n=1 Tax=Gloeothece verrucosa (strain PCC 7822) TaxID=497965 RepID=E0UK10_GLOV7|nr:bifunctional cobalt-precorrin-7 (C(5))-methyltransferase/cobalt-precorrin-6B (C(15))-methyltransferase [Gloeothece verrucosa]ADN14646.1 precorrin-6y C5,15-methyltransferase (decarboxylating), CbiE subunit [Gloeothece verrucosa PCC 7822]